MVPQPASLPPTPRFQFKIAPNTPVKDLLPVAPKLKKTRALLVEDLTRVPEVEFQAAPAKEVVGLEATKSTAHMIAKINHLNDKKADGFLEALLAERPDLASLPMAMGDACRTKGERSRQFTLAVATVRRALQSPIQAQPNLQPVALTQSINGVITSFGVSAVAPATLEGFWEQYRALCTQEDKAASQIDRAQREAVTVARVAALMQVLAPESPDMRLGLVKYLSTVAHVEATRALARMVLFSAEDEVRQAAIDALKVRRERDYTEVLLKGLHYPLPAVARHAASAMVSLERTDLLPQLVALLDEPDPRAPVVKEVNKKKTPVVRELVRINHHRNCLLCHAPGNTGKVGSEALTAAVPVPGEPLPSPSEGYRTSSPDVLVRIDVTYLRQDFSMFQPVADASPWPEMQRFDFLVRTRPLTDDEADAYREKLTRREPGQLSPYHRVALTALRELTGKDTEPSAAAWRKLLELSTERQ
jgi:hypothetical protein